MEEKVMMVFAIDPGPKQSAFVIWNGEKIWDKGLVSNDMLLNLVHNTGRIGMLHIDHLAIEMVASYGMAVGKDVFETCVWIGRFIERWNRKHRLIYRREIKLHHCRSLKAKDTNIRQALVDRFASGFSNYGKGTKVEPSIFYGFKADLWQAMAVAVFAYDTWVPERRKK